jgi:hypothetical protein
MLRKFVSSAMALVLVFAVASTADAQAKKGKGKKAKGTVGKITKVDGDKITVAVKVKKGETEDKTFTLTSTTKFFDGKTAVTDEGKLSQFKKSVLTVGTVVRIQADKSGNVTTLTKPAPGKKKPKADK